LRSGGFTSFVECGADEIVTRLIRKNFPDDSSVKGVAVAASGEGVKNGIENLLRTFALENRPPAGPATGEPAADNLADQNRIEKPAAAEAKPLQVPVAIVAMGCV